MGRLIDDLLEFSRIGRAELHFQNVSLRSLLDQTLQAAQPDVADRPIRWTIDSLPEVNGDAAMLRQVFANLIDNAVKFARTRNPAEIEIGCRPAENEHVVFVRDNGVGFDPHYAHKLVRSFSTSAQRRRIRRNGHRLGHRSPDHRAPRRPDLGRGGPRPGRNHQFLSATLRQTMSQTETLCNRRTASHARAGPHPAG